MKNIVYGNHQTLALTVILVICTVWIGCTQKSAEENATISTGTTQNISSSTAAPPHHEHKPPHHGTLVVLGKEFSHIEMVLDPETGKLTAYALDGEAENPVKLVQNLLDLKITLNKKVHTLQLKAIANPLTGETIGDTSEFSGQADYLKGVKSFDAVLSAINIRGSQFNDVAFNFPKGNDTD